MIPRISPTQTHANVKTGQSLLVCAYDSDDKCHTMHLAGALLPSEFLLQVPTLPRDREIIFYCAWTHEHSSAGQAEAYRLQGFTNVKALEGGVAAWKEAGLPFAAP